MTGRAAAGRTPAASLLDAGLVACANIAPTMRPLFIWIGLFPGCDAARPAIPAGLAR